MERLDIAPGLARDTWARFLEEYESRLDRFRSQVATCWEEVLQLLDELDKAAPAAFDRELEAGKLNALVTCFGDCAVALIERPARSRLKGRQQQRALAAITDLDTGLEDAIRRLPARVLISGAELADLLGPRLCHGFDRRWMMLRRRRTPLPLRDLILDHVRNDSFFRARLDGEFQLLLARATLWLAGPWSIFRRRSLPCIENPGDEPANTEAAMRRWRAGTRAYAQRAGKLLARYARWCETAPSFLATRLRARQGPRPEFQQRKERDAGQRYFVYWSRQERAVTSILELELAMAALARRANMAAGESLSLLESEHQALLAELEEVIDALEKSLTSADKVLLPPPKAKLLSAEARVDRWLREVGTASRAELPNAIETADPKLALPGWRSPWKQLEPEALIERIIQGSGRRTALAGFGEAQEAHQAIVREIERAREVVAFGAETARQEGEEGQRVAVEGITNAIELLRYQKDNTTDVRIPAERSLAQSIAGIFLDAFIAVEQGRLGTLRHLFRETSEQGLRRLWLLGVETGRRALRTAWKHARRLWIQALYALGLKTPPTPHTAAVFRTERLGEALRFHLVHANLPLIYRRLFRLEPVEDPRFLVGRDDELAGLTEARCLWLAGKAVSILVIGARGSGKTSLINCAEQVAFSGLDIVRGQFRGRITTREEIGQFLRQLLGLDAGADLVASLNVDHQRVIVLEELERTYLRRMNGFAALHHLLELVTATWHSVLWVLSLNETAHQFLDRAMGLNRYFSHRVNAMAVLPEEIRNAIMLRHNLSGYRLAFAPPPERDPRVSSLRRILGLEREAQELFFESLYDQSEGIFRSAFELWQHQIERVEGGVVHMRHPVDPDYSRLLKTLGNDDCFTLQAILQHGGLTPAALSEVFLEPDETSRSRLERLMALEILETDPAGPGLRVRPEAGKLVREALHRQNL